MLLNELLEEVKYGEEYVASKNTIQEIKDLINEDFQLYSVSKRVNNLLKECDMGKEYAKNLARASRNYSDFEDRILSLKESTTIYKRLKANSIIEDINLAITNLEKNPKVLRESNITNLGKIIATLKYAVSVLEEGTKTIRDTNSILSSIILEESNMLYDVLKEK